MGSERGVQAGQGEARDVLLHARRVASLKREAAEAAARRDAAALDKLDKAHSVEFVRARTQAQKSQAKRKGERNASVYNRLLRESRRSRARRRAGTTAARAPRAGKENDAPPRASQYGPLRANLAPASSRGVVIGTPGTPPRRTRAAGTGRPPSQRMPGRRTRTTIGGARAAAETDPRRTRRAPGSTRALPRSRRRTKRTPTPPRFPTWVPTRFRRGVRAARPARSWTPSRTRTTSTRRRRRRRRRAKRRPSRLRPPARESSPRRALRRRRTSAPRTTRRVVSTRKTTRTRSSDVASLTLGSEDSRRRPPRLEPEEEPRRRSRARARGATPTPTTWTSRRRSVKITRLCVRNCARPRRRSRRPRANAPRRRRNASARESEPRRARRARVLPPGREPN